MQSEEAKILLGLPPTALASPSQVKAAYRKKAWESHPDRFPSHEKAQAECKFKLISEAYSYLNSGGRSQGIEPTETYSWVVKTSVGSRAHDRQRNTRIASVPFLVIILSALTLGGSTATRAYQRQKETQHSFNPFLP